VKLSGATGKRIILNAIDVLAGDDYHPADLSRATYIEGITSNTYTMQNMIPGYYALRVQALYTDGVLSPWSNRVRTLINWKKGDVNHDGEINVADANQVIDAVLLDHNSPRAIATVDVNGDGEINISDINAVVDRILQDY
jgi:hypothetical protein